MILIESEYDPRDWADYLEALKRFGGIHPEGNGEPIDNVNRRPSRNWRGTGPRHAHSKYGSNAAQKAQKQFVDSGWGHA